MLKTGVGAVRILQNCRLLSSRSSRLFSISSLSRKKSSRLDRSSPSPVLSTSVIRHERAGFMFKPIGAQTSKFSTNAEAEVKETSYHNIIKDSEKGTGQVESREFQAETRMLLDIVAKSLYSDSEVFIRELISNASDALEKFRYMSLSGQNVEGAGRPLEIHMSTDKTNRIFSIQDTGIGMTKEEMIENLGTIAKSGSKAFLEKLQESKSAGGLDPSSIIGQFGVGFYASFMVGSRVDVYSKSSAPDSKGYKWTSDGSGSYEIQEAEGVQVGTKIAVHLKADHRQFGDEETVNGIVKKYSNFVGSPIFLNGKQVNTVQALWMQDPKEVTEVQHQDFYHFISGAYDKPRFVLHFNTDVPLSIRCLLYVPEQKPGFFDMSREHQVGVGLYCRKVMIKNRADNIIPTWLRFLKGVVDSEDIPLNLSRELLQDSALIRKLKTVVTNRFLRFLNDKSQKQPEEFAKFYKDYGLFLKEGIITEQEQMHKEDIAKLIRFESSLKPSGELVSLPEYASRMQAAQKDIFYLAAPSRELAERSPYMEALREQNMEVLFCFEPYDEVVLLHLRQFDRKTLTSVEKEMRQMKESLNMDALPIGSMSKPEAESLILWLQNSLKGKAHTVKFTQKLDKHPCVVTIEEMGAARHFLKTQGGQIAKDARMTLLQPQFEVNVKHTLVKKLATLKDSQPEIAAMIADQLFMNAMVTAGLEEDPRNVVSPLNDLLAKIIEKL